MKEANQKGVSLFLMIDRENKPIKISKKITFEDGFDQFLTDCIRSARRSGSAVIPEA